VRLSTRVLLHAGSTNCCTIAHAAAGMPSGGAGQPHAPVAFWHVGAGLTMPPKICAHAAALVAQGTCRTKASAQGVGAGVGAGAGAVVDAMGIGGAGVGTCSGAGVGAGVAGHVQTPPEHEGAGAITKPKAFAQTVASVAHGSSSVLPPSHARSAARAALVASSKNERRSMLK